MKTLDEIARHYGTDKSSEIHNYCVKYEKYLPFKREDRIRILEIGVLEGKSILTWAHYFPNAEIIGIDIVEGCRKHQKGNIKIEIGDQYSQDFLASIVDKYKEFDMILDDGSHHNTHVIFSYEKLFPSIKSGGVYVIEDCTTSYWTEFGGGYQNPASTMEYFKRLTDDVNYQGLKVTSFRPQIYARREDILDAEYIRQNLKYETTIESINFLNGLILITKK